MEDAAMPAVIAIAASTTCHASPRRARNLARRTKETGAKGRAEVRASMGTRVPSGSARRWKLASRGGAVMNSGQDGGLSAETQRVRRVQDKEAPRYDRQISFFERVLFGGG